MVLDADRRDGHIVFMKEYGIYLNSNMKDPNGRDELVARVTFEFTEKVDDLDPLSASIIIHLGNFFAGQLNSPHSSLSMKEVK